MTLSRGQVGCSGRVRQKSGRQEAEKRKTAGSRPRLLCVTFDTEIKQEIWRKNLVRGSRIISVKA